MKETNVILKNEFSLAKPEPDQIQTAYNILEKHMTLVQNNNRLFESGIGLKISNEFDDVSLKRSTMVDSKVINSKFSNCALTGSHFGDDEFKNTCFIESNLQYCHFFQNKFINTTFNSTNLSYSNFYQTVFEQVTFIGSTVSEILFENCIFKNCIFTASMLENTLFNGCTMEKVKFIKTNVEYMDLRDCKIENVLFPMAQIPYIFGIFDYLLEGKVIVNGDNQKISMKEYIDMQHSLLVYYTSIQEFFPLANIYLSTGEFNNGYQSIVAGVKQSIVQRNFRMLKFYCKQATRGNVFNYKELRTLYHLIENLVYNEKMDIFEQRSFVYNIAEIRSLLLENIDGFPSVRIELQTNIDSLESSKVAQFIEYIDTVINELCTNKISHIEYSHNSDANFIVYISAHYQEILLVISSLMILANNALDNIQKRILQHQQIQLNKIQLEREQKELTKAQQEKLEKKQNELMANNINFSIKYIINNCDDVNDINIYL